jgi:hypothetical protein
MHNSRARECVRVRVCVRAQMAESSNGNWSSSDMRLKRRLGTSLSCVDAILGAKQRSFAWVFTSPAQAVDNVRAPNYRKQPLGLVCPPNFSLPLSVMVLRLLAFSFQAASLTAGYVTAIPYREFNTESQINQLLYRHNVSN